MRLLFLTNYYPPNELGGFEQLCHEIVQGLNQRGHQVFVLTSRNGVNNSKSYEPNVLRSLYLQSDYEKYQPLDFWLNFTRKEKSNKYELINSLETLSPEIVFIWGMWNLSLNLPYWAEQKMPGRVVYYLASYWPIDTDIHEEYWLTPARRQITELVKRPLRFLAFSRLNRNGYPPRLKYLNAKCCSRYVRGELVGAGKLPKRTGVLFVGINPDPFLHQTLKLQSEPNNIRLVYFGSLLPQKGVHTAIEALGILNERGYLPQLDLTILGSGHPDYEAQLKDLVESLRIQDKVHFAGRVPRDDIPSWLGKFDVYLFTSIWPEPMARTVMEAMAAGLLIIGSEVGGQTEMLIDGLNSLTYQPEDAYGLANQIIKVLNNPSMRHQLSKSGKEMVLKTFTLDRMTTEIETWLTDISKSHGGDG